LDHHVQEAKIGGQTLVVVQGKKKEKKQGHAKLQLVQRSARMAANDIILTKETAINF
jgi:hypothetical protein